MGKLDEVDYRELKRALEDRALSAMTAIERARGACAPRPCGSPRSARIAPAPAGPARRSAAGPRARRHPADARRPWRRPSAGRQLLPAMRCARRRGPQLLRRLRRRPCPRHRALRVACRMMDAPLIEARGLRPHFRCDSHPARRQPGRRGRDSRANRRAQRRRQIDAGASPRRTLRSDRRRRPAVRCAQPHARFRRSPPRLDRLASEFSLSESHRAREPRVLRRAVSGHRRACGDFALARAGRINLLRRRASADFLRAAWNSA